MICVDTGEAAAAVTDTQEWHGRIATMERDGGCLLPVARATSAPP